MLYRYTLLMGCALVLTLFLSCTPLQADDPQQVLEADRRFSTLSKHAGYRDAFVIFADSNAILLRNAQPPILGKEDIKTAYAVRDIQSQLVWQPLHAEVSGNLGYTYGTFELTRQDSLGQAITKVGYYTTIWKKQPNGDWKFVLDAGTIPDTRAAYQLYEE